MRLPRDSLIVLGILVVISATYLLVVYRSQAKCLGGLRTQSAERKRQLDADAARASRVPPMLREVESMKQRYNKDWDRRLPRRIELSGFLREISANLAEEKLLNQMTAPGDPSRGPLYNVLPITMKFEGDFLALAGFLKRVDAMTRLTRIEQLKIQPNPGSKNLAIEVGMNIYFTEQ